MTDSLIDQIKNKKNTYLIVYIVKELFRYCTKENQAPTWLQKYRIYNRRPAVLFRDQTVGIKKEWIITRFKTTPQERKIYMKVFKQVIKQPISSVTSILSCNQIIVPPRYSIILIKTMNKYIKMKMKSYQADIISASTISISPTGILDVFPKNISTNLKVRTIPKCFFRTKRKYLQDVSTPYHRIIYHYLCRLLKEINHCHIFISNLLGMYLLIKGMGYYIFYSLSCKCIRKLKLLLLEQKQNFLEH